MRLIRLYLVLFGGLVAAESATAELKTVPFVELSQYAGTWYQIARKPVFFENGCVCSRQVLTPEADGRIAVYNSCNNLTSEGSLREIRGFATVDDPVTNAKLVVDFGLPKLGAYWIIALDSQYRYAVVTDPAQSTLYVLSRTPVLEESLYQQAISEISGQVDVSSLTLTAQSNCAYPPEPVGQKSWLDPQEIPRSYRPAKGELANIDEPLFRNLIQKIQDRYSNVVSKFSGRLSISGDWRSETPNAGAAQLFGNWQVKVTGGLARRPELTPDGFTLIVCHEMGHHLGGFSFGPANPPFMAAWAANEGQSDYYSTHVCAKRMWQNDLAVNATYRLSTPERLRSACDSVWSNEQDQNLCYRTMSGAQSVIATMAAIKNVPMPDVDTPDTNIVSQTDHNHPAPQCRLDTTYQAALCTKDFSDEIIPGKSHSNEPNSLAGERESNAYTCGKVDGFQVGTRPSCWFKSNL